jgi:hypothetical protein
MKIILPIERRRWPMRWIETWRARKAVRVMRANVEPWLGQDEAEQMIIALRRTFKERDL